MNCPECNYELSPLDEECPRCKRLAEAALRPPPPPGAQQPGGGGGPLLEVQGPP